MLPVSMVHSYFAF